MGASRGERAGVEGILFVQRVCKVCGLWLVRGVRMEVLLIMEKMKLSGRRKEVALKMADMFDIKVHLICLASVPCLQSERAKFVC